MSRTISKEPLRMSGNGRWVELWETQGMAYIATNFPEGEIDADDPEAFRHACAGVEMVLLALWPHGALHSMTQDARDQMLEQVTEALANDL